MRGRGGPNKKVCRLVIPLLKVPSQAGTNADIIINIKKFHPDKCRVAKAVTWAEDILVPPKVKTIGLSGGKNQGGI